MSFVSPSRRLLTRDDSRVIHPRRWLLPLLGLMLCLNLATFVAGVWVGRDQPALPAIAVGPSAAEASEAHFALDRLGELVGRLKSLEADTRVLQRMLSEQRKLSEQVSKLDPELLPATLGDAQGGILLPPRSCDSSSVVSSLEGLAQSVGAARCLRRQLDQMLEGVTRRNAELMAIPTLRPVQGARLGSAFGNRIDPFNRRLAFHSGVDFALPSGSEVRAAAGGRVRSAGRRAGYGNLLVIDHGNGLTTRYAHLSRIEVKVGELVTPGQRVATVGSTGRSTGPHLHFEVKQQGRFVDPQRFLALGDLALTDDALAHD